MAIEDFHKHFTSYGLTYNPEGWHHAYHLELDDNGQGGSSGSWNWCGSSCTRYTAKVKNDFNGNNKIHVGLHTWRNRGYGTANCDDAMWSGGTHGIFQEGDQWVRTFWNEENWLTPITVNANDEVEHTIELDLSRRDMSKDWSITAWGENGPVSIEVVGKGNTDHFPFVRKDDSKLPPSEGGTDSNDNSTNDQAAIDAAEDAERQ